MTERSYTLKELDAMRAGIWRQHKTTAPYVYINSAGWASDEHQRRRDAWENKMEELLRTALMANVDPAEFAEPTNETPKP